MAASKMNRRPGNLTIDDINWLSVDEDEFEVNNGSGTFRVARDGQAVSLLTVAENAWKRH